MLIVPWDSHVGRLQTRHAVFTCKVKYVKVYLGCLAENASYILASLCCKSTMAWSLSFSPETHWIALALSLVGLWQFTGRIVHRYFLSRYTTVEGLPLLGVERQKKINGTAVVCGGRQVPPTSELPHDLISTQHFRADHRSRLL